MTTIFYSWSDQSLINIKQDSERQVFSRATQGMDSSSSIFSVVMNTQVQFEIWIEFYLEQMSEASCFIDKTSAHQDYITFNSCLVVMKRYYDCFLGVGVLNATSLSSPPLSCDSGVSGVIICQFLIIQNFSEASVVPCQNCNFLKLKRKCSLRRSYII